MQIAVASGKGGTGKTTIATNLAYVKDNVQYVDCDVEAPNGHLFLNPEITEEKEASILIPQLIKEKCDYCGVCAEVCAYNAIFVTKNNWSFFKDLCHGCGSCTYFCPQKALIEVKSRIGIVRKGNKNNIRFIGGELDIGQAMSPPLIRLVKKEIDTQIDTVIDAPPGTTCPAIEGIKDSDFVILVAEPTPFGLSDLELMVEVVRKVKIPFSIFINKKGITDDRELEQYIEKESLDVIGFLPFSEKIAEVYSKGKLIVEILPEYKKLFLEIWNKIRQVIND